MLIDCRNPIFAPAGSSKNSRVTKFPSASDGVGFPPTLCRAFSYTSMQRSEFTDFSNAGLMPLENQKHRPGLLRSPTSECEFPLGQRHPTAERRLLTPRRDRDHDLHFFPQTRLIFRAACFPITKVSARHKSCPMTSRYSPLRRSRALHNRPSNIRQSQLLNRRGCHSESVGMRANSSSAPIVNS